MKGGQSPLSAHSQTQRDEEMKLREQKIFELQQLVSLHAAQLKEIKTKKMDEELVEK